MAHKLRCLGSVRWESANKQGSYKALDYKELHVVSLLLVLGGGGARDREVERPILISYTRL